MNKSIHSFTFISQVSWLAHDLQINELISSWILKSWDSSSCPFDTLVVFQRWCYLWHPSNALHDFNSFCAKTKTSHKKDVGLQCCILYQTCGYKFSLNKQIFVVSVNLMSVWCSDVLLSGFLMPKKHVLNTETTLKHFKKYSVKG